MSVLGNERLEKLQRNLGYHFQDPKHLELALTHRSIGHQPERNNERLEFLGDAVLQLSISSYLYHRFPRLPEGELAKIRSLLVRESTLAEVARDLELNHCLMVGKGERRAKAQERDSLLCDVLEAVYGAIFLDGGYNEARRVIIEHLPQWDAQQMPLIDAKSTLQEHFQQVAKKPPVYRLVQEEGPDHDKSFVVEVRFEEECLGTGRGHTKKEAEQEAARSALVKMSIQE